MKIYHLLPGNSPHIVPFIIQRFVADCEEMGTTLEDHCFVIYGDTEEDNKPAYRIPGVPWQQITFLRHRPDVLARFLWSIPTDAMLILHGMVYRGAWFALLSRPSLWRRTAWLLWGADVHSFASPKEEKRWISPLARFRRLRRAVDRRLRTIVVQRIGAIGAQVPGDFDVLQHHCGKLTNYRRIFYCDDPITPVTPVCDEKRSWQGIRICLGNSATQSNNHLQALEWLSRFRDENIQVFCPLNYNFGSPEYRDMVVDAGKNLLGDKFQPLLEMLPREQFATLLRSMDILVFNHSWQQGLFSLLVMLSEGKKCFIRSETSSYALMQSLGIRVFESESISSLSFADFCNLAPELVENNRRKYREHLSLEASIRGWKKLFADFRTSPDGNVAGDVGSRSASG
jgi:dTDP-N-acetylfucosamine:lipid II N-acetylfucosaminyltransferase